MVAALAAILTAAALLFLPGRTAGADPNMGGGGGGGSSSNCPNGYTHVHNEYNGQVTDYCQPPATQRQSTATSNFAPQQSTKNKVTPKPAAPAGDFAGNLPAAPTQTPTAVLSADPPAAGAGAATNGPAVDINGKPISTSDGDDDIDAFAGIGLFLVLMGLGALALLLWKALLGVRDEL